MFLSIIYKTIFFKKPAIPSTKNSNKYKFIGLNDRIAEFLLPLLQRSPKQLQTLKIKRFLLLNLVHTNISCDWSELSWSIA